MLGDAGLIVPANQPAELAAALLRILREPQLAGDLEKRGPQRAAQFSVEAMVANYEALYTELCPAPG